MIDLQTSYMGLKLKNPLIVSASKLTYSIDSLKKIEDNGAGAVIVKSLFEEQILAERNEMIQGLDDSIHTDAYDFYSNTSANYYVDKYLTFMEDAIKSVKIPVIPSLNCVTSGNWIEYAKRFENIGCQALELNVFLMPNNSDVTGTEIENIYFDIASKIKQEIKIPVSMKIGYHFTGMANVIKRLSDEFGIDALVLFNRYYRPDIDIEKMKVITGQIFTSPVEMLVPLHWVAMMSGGIKADISAATGIHDAESVIKQLLAGAKTVQICSALYKNGFEYLRVILDEMQSWMNRHDYSKIQDFNGKLSQQNIDKPELYDRTQYIKALVGLS